MNTKIQMHKKTVLARCVSLKVQDHRLVTLVSNTGIPSPALQHRGLTVRDQGVCGAQPGPLGNGRAVNQTGANLPVNAQLWTPLTWECQALFEGQACPSRAPEPFPRSPAEVTSRSVEVTEAGWLCATRASGGSDRTLGSPRWLRLSGRDVAEC